jgi:predicted DNA-binding transcriptional regulator YafY
MTTLTRETVRTYLERAVTNETRYFKAHEIAAELNASPKSVAQYLRQLQDSVEDITIEQGGRSKSITWKVTASGEP